MMGCGRASEHGASTSTTWPTADTTGHVERTNLGRSLARPVIELRRYSDSPPRLSKAYDGRWTELPACLSVDELTALAHAFNGYIVAGECLGQEAGVVAARLERTHREKGSWEGALPELLVTFFCVVRSWRGCYDYPKDGDENHQTGHGLYEAVVRRLQAHPDEVEFKVIVETNEP